MIELFLDEDDVWVQPLNRTVGVEPRPTLFLDRDGVVIEERGYISDPASVALIPGTAAVIRKANQRNIPVVLVTNQGGIALGKFGFQEFVAVQDRMLDLLAQEDAFVNLVCASPHHQRGTGTYAHPDHQGRKPNPGMLLKAAERLPIHLRTSWIVGDRASDLLAGHRAGLQGGIHVLSGHGSDGGEREKALTLAAADYQALGAASLAEAAGLLRFLKH